MTKSELLALIATKTGYTRTISDKLAPDSIAGDTVEKRHIVVEHTNSDGTAGITNVYYLLDTTSDQAKFYNAEPEAFDFQELSVVAKKQEALEKYLKGKYNAYFLSRVDLVNNWAEVDVFTLTTGKLVKKSILVFKQGNNPINDLDVI